MTRFKPEARNCWASCRGRRSTLLEGADDLGEGVTLLALVQSGMAARRHSGDSEPVEHEQRAFDAAEFLERSRGLARSSPCRMKMRRRQYRHRLRIQVAAEDSGPGARHNGADHGVMVVRRPMRKMSKSPATRSPPSSAQGSSRDTAVSRRLLVEQRVRSGGTSGDQAAVETGFWMPRRNQFIIIESLVGSTALPSTTLWVPLPCPLKAPGPRVATSADTSIPRSRHPRRPCPSRRSPLGRLDRASLTVSP